MPNIPQRRKLTEALKVMLQDQVGYPVGVANAPKTISGEVESLPYLVIYPLDSGVFMGPEWCAPEADAIFEFQISSFGLRYDQTEWLMDQVRIAIIDRDDYGQLVNRLTFDDHVVMDQRLVGPAGKLDEVGQIWSGHESYHITVTSQP